MRIVMHSEFDLTVSDFHSSEFDVSADEHAHANYSALQMFATSLALCTGSVLISYGEGLKVESHDLSIRVKWTVEEKPRRIGSIDMDIRWPDLPESRREAAQRAAAHCAIHNSLHHPPRVVTAVNKGEGGTIT
jgi:uncharacterized OsmC-like protein